ncbi:luciferin 4-monooxygenase-like isoform X3 [Cataglyphis hispanica]|uniref:luciferin 4-monooxygenase-like isoform X3 n=1 Tax=Cataglyphis hispanica TaxID=1086592 RepID=UPI0021801928|nr:luciferin 4-monooxygenase-like isoform X3 [Cataglyphis hispanica]
MAQSTSLNIVDNIVMGKESPIDDNINIGELILKAFKIKPDFVGQVDAITEEENTFQQMRKRSVKCALWLKKIGVQRNDIVTVCTFNHLDAYIPYLASLYIGAILSVWPDEHIGNLRYFIQSCPKVIFTDIDKAPTIHNVAKIMNVSTKIVVFKKECEEEERFESLNSILNNDFDEDEIDKFSCTKLESSKDTAVILFSSGSIDYLRKHVTIPHSFFISPSNQHVPIMIPNNVGIWLDSLHWNIGLLLTIRCILSYVKAIKVYKDIKTIATSQVSLSDSIQKYQVNWLFLKSDALKYFNFNIFKSCNMPSFKQLLFTCTTIPIIFMPRIADALPKTSIIVAYCLPETGIITIHRFDKIKRDLISYMAKNVSLFFADFNTELPLNEGKLGYIRCNTPCLTNGYFDSSTRNIVSAIDKNGWFHTEEIGTYTKENIHIFERGVTGHVITYKNYRFSPIELEKLLRTHPAVRYVVVVPVFHPFDTHHPMALIIRKENVEVTKKEIIEYVAARVDDRKQLRAGVLFMDDLPSLYTGVFDRKQIFYETKKFLATKQI